MDGKRFDQLAKSFVGTSRRSLLKAMVGILSGGVLGTIGPGESDAAARRRLPGQICRRAADCASGSCGPRDRTGRRRCLCVAASDCPRATTGDSEFCGKDGVCLSCFGVVSWADTNLRRIGDFDRLASSIIDDITTMAVRGFNGEVLEQIRDSTSEIGTIDEAIRADIAPRDDRASGSVTRALIEVFAAAMAALSAYLEQVYEESYIETGEQTLDALDTVVETVGLIEGDIVALRSNCGR